MTENTERYGVRLLMRHPSLSPEDITNALELKPTHSWLVGTRRVTPKGDVLQGVYPNTTWSHSYKVIGRKNFSNDICDVLNILDRNVEFVRKLVSSGGAATLIINLPGDTNVGDEIGAHHLARLANLKVGLGFEVFPTFN